MEEIQDNCMRIPVGCVILRCEWIVRSTLLLWIPSPSLRVNCCLDLEQQVYGWVEHPSQATGCTNIL
jgi:hypothetical protein